MRRDPGDKRPLGGAPYRQRRLAWGQVLAGIMSDRGAALGAGRGWGYPQREYNPHPKPPSLPEGP